MAERELGFARQRRSGPGDDEPPALQRAKRLGEVRPGIDRLQRRRPEHPPDDSRVLERLLLPLWQSVHARSEQCAHGARNGQSFSVRCGHLPSKLLGEQRVSLGGRDDVLGELGTIVGEQRRDERARLFLGQRLQADLRGPGAGRPPDVLLAELGPSAHDQQHWPRRPSEYQLHHLQQRFLGPVRILDYDQHGTARRQTRQERRPRQRNLIRDGTGRDPPQRIVWERDPGRDRKRRDHPVGVRRINDSGDSLAQLRRRGHGRVAERDSGRRPENFAQRPVRDPLAVRQAASAVHGRSGRQRDPRHELVDQAGLAHAGLTEEDRQSWPLLLHDRLVHALQRGQLVGPTDERRRCRLLPARPDLVPQGSHQPRRAAIPRLVVAHSGRSLHRRTVDRHAAGRRAPGDPDGFTNRPANRCRGAPVGHGDEDFAGGDAGAHNEPGISQADGRPHCTFGVVLVRDRRAEQRDDITLGGGFDRRPEPFQLYVQALVRPGCRCAEVLGIAVACDAGEFCGQDRNDLALLALRPTRRLQLPVGRRLARRRVARRRVARRGFGCGSRGCGGTGRLASHEKPLVHRSDRRARRDPELVAESHAQLFVGLQRRGDLPADGQHFHLGAGSRALVAARRRSALGRPPRRLQADHRRGPGPPGRVTRAREAEALQPGGGGRVPTRRRIPAGTPRRATRTPVGLGRARASHRRHRARYPPGESPPRLTPGRSSHPRAARARLPACPPARPDRAPAAASRATRRARPPDSQADPRATTCRSVRRGSRPGFDCTPGRRTRAGLGDRATQS